MNEYVQRLINCGMPQEEAVRDCREFVQGVSFFELENYVKDVENHVDSVQSKPNREVCRRLLREGCSRCTRRGLGAGV